MNLLDYEKSTSPLSVLSQKAGPQAPLTFTALAQMEQESEQEME